ncbi:MAG: hypothetical protein JWM85_2312 [Acidimicrobiaceae bacterium]|nr:hypothetical protein [Acidimicrobiaceae bacterium]
MKLSPRAAAHPYRSTATAAGLLSVGLAIALPLGLSGTALAATATPVLLGTAGTYSLLAGSGMTNSGISTVVGDVGSSPTPAQTGFTPCPGAANCVLLTGQNHTVADSATQLAKTDLTTAYNAATAQTPVQVATELAGQSLTAGVYTAGSGTFQINGTLVLNGQNDPNAVFIFQTSSTLITGSASNVSLVNGAQACNIFWQVGSAATLGSASTLQGTVMAHDDISLANAVTVDGRLLAGEQASGAGAVTLIGDTIVRPATCLTASSTVTTTSAATTTTVAAVAAATTTTTSPTAAAASRATSARAAKARAAKARAARIRATRASEAAARKLRAAQVAAATKAAAAAPKKGFAQPVLHSAAFTG